MHLVSTGATVAIVSAVALVVSGGAVETLSPEDDHNKVLLIQGIASESTCIGDGDFKERLSWLTSALSESDAAPGISPGDFLYYAYESPYTETGFSKDKTVRPGGTCADGETPRYSKKDSCWSLDDVYKSGGEKPVLGQAKRLAAYLEDYFEDEDNPRNLSIIAHSQGGVLATYTILEELAKEYQHRITAIITLDSPLRGINSLSAPLLQLTSACAGDPRLDSSFDMLPGSAVINRIATEQEDNPPPTKLYTVNAKPGCLAGAVKSPDPPRPLQIFVKVASALLKVACVRVPLINDAHSDLAWWSNSNKNSENTRHITVGAQTHTDIWAGCFVSRSKCDDDSSATELGAEGERLVRFISCAVSNQTNSNCKEVAD